MADDLTWKVVELSVRSGVPVVIWGEPGIGKTRRVEALAERMGLPCETVISSVREPSDFGGLPDISDDGVFMHAPAWAKRLVAAGKGILFLDEISTAPPAVQAALLRVVLDRWVGDVKLPDEVSIVSAANPPKCAAGGWELSPPLANRLVHVEAEVDVDAWLDWCAEQNSEGLSLCAAYIKHSPQSLHQMPKDAAPAGKAWPSPRSWDQAAMLIDEALAAGLGIKSPVVVSAVCSLVGEGAGIAWAEWVRSLDLPDPEVLLTNPKSWKVPKRGDVVYATLSAVLLRVRTNPTEDRWVAAWKVLDQAVKGAQPDIAAAQARALTRLKPAGAKTPKEVAAFMPLLRDAGIVGA